MAHSMMSVNRTTLENQRSKNMTILRDPDSSAGLHCMYYVKKQRQVIRLVKTKEVGKVYVGIIYI